MACAPCEAEARLYRPATEFAGLSGISDIVPADVLGATQPTVSMGLTAIAMGQGALSGLLLGGLSAGSWKGGGTGALLGAGIAGVGAGAALMIASSAAPNAALRFGGVMGLVAGGVALVAGGMRASRAIKGRKG